MNLTPALSHILSSSMRASLRSLALPRAPKHVRSNYRAIPPKDLDTVAKSLRENFFAQRRLAEDPERYLKSVEGQGDFKQHLHERMNNDRASIVPWLDSARKLHGTRILEIGCGTGSSTVALAEQGAEVTAVDIDEPALQVARDRCAAYGVRASFSSLNCTEVAQQFANERFDFIIFFASLEHMTYKERLLAMKSTWEMLRKGSFWCVVEAPNRLWYMDGHTSWLPFFNWLPDDLAFDYLRFSPRKEIQSAKFREHNPQATLDFLRLGRGVSYHEFDLAFKPCQELKVLSSLFDFLRQRSLLWRAKAILNGESKFETFLANVGPPIHRGFFQSDLNLIIQKD